MIVWAKRILKKNTKIYPAKNMIGRGGRGVIKSDKERERTERMVDKRIVIRRRDMCVREWLRRKVGK